MHQLKPESFDSSKQSLEDFKKTHDIQNVIDSYADQLEELFLIRNPRFRFIPDRKKEIADFTIEQLAGKTLEQHGNWFYFPWDKTLVHYLPDEIFQEIRTARNKNLILPAEQKKFYETTVGIAGLSVGSHAALTIVMNGGAKNIKLADPDTISPSNLNRIRYGATTIGINKAIVAARVIAEMNPYSNIYVYDEGVTEENKEGFFAGADGTPKIDIIIEEIDNLPMKIGIRLMAKKHQLPLIQATDNGDGIIVDVERYDLDPNTQLFNGAIGDIKGMEDFAKYKPTDMPMLATKVAGPEFVQPRMLASLAEVGKTLYSWPQLGTAATICGSAISFLIRQIANGKKIASKKYDLNLDFAFETMNEEERKVWDAERQQYLKHLGL